MSSVKVRAKIADTVKFKKVDGTLMLLENEVSWVPTGNAAAKRFTCLYSDIKVQRISPETSSKVQLQILLKDDSSNNFHFSNEQGRAVQMQERNVVKDLLAELIPLHREKANRDLEEKNKVFMEQPELYQLYKELVVSNIITAQEFWEHHSTNINTDVKKQQVGIASGVLAEIKPDMHGCNELRFNLTADTIEAIFKMYPEIRQKYISQVPHETTEKEFWTEFFKSKHFHRDRIVNNSSTKDVFGDLAKKDEQNTLTKNTEAFFDPLLNFASPSPNAHEGYGRKDAEKTTSSNNMALIKQFNHQSMMVLEKTAKRTAPSESSDSASCRKKRLREVMEYNDLEQHYDAVVTNTELRIDKAAFNAAQHTETNGHTNGTNGDMEGRNETFREEVASWTPRLSQVLVPDVAKLISIELSPGGKHMPDTGKQRFQDNVPADTLKETKKVYLALSELLRHFWSCFPTKTPQLEEKVSRMAVAIEKYRDTKLANFRCMLPTQHSQLVAHLDDIIAAALKKYAGWEERKSGAKVANIS